MLNASSGVGFTTGLVITLSTWLANTVSQCDTGHNPTKSALLKLPLACDVNTSLPSLSFWSTDTLNTLL